MKACKTVDYSCGRNPLNFGMDPVQGGQMASILGFCGVEIY